jgi:hypothetical protein
MPETPATDTHAEYVIMISFPIQRMHGRASMLHNMYIASLDYLHKCTSMTWLNNVDFYVDYLPEDVQKRPKHVGGLLHLIVYLCTSLCSSWNKHYNKIKRIVVIKPQAFLTFVLGDESKFQPPLPHKVKCIVATVYDQGEMPD